MLRIALTALLLLLVAVAFLPVVGNGWINYDDDVYITANPLVQRGLSADGLRWALTTTHGGNWHPLTWLSHMLDCQLFGTAPLGPHLVNVGLHAANAALMFWFLSGQGRNRRGDGASSATAALSRNAVEDTRTELLGPARMWAAALAAALFALHPLRVEAVAWAAERKELLSAFFGWLTILLYACYTRQPGRARFAWYFASLLCLALGLLAKPMLVTLPALLCVLDAWPGQRRIQFVDKSPYLLVAVASAGATLVAQANFGNTQLLEPVSLPIRLANGAITAVTYLRQTVWPADLTCFYPYPRAWLETTAGMLTALAAAALLAAITVGCVLLRSRFRWLLAGWLWYAVALAPVIGIVQVGRQSHADRYTYWPAIGLSWIVAWGVVISVRGAPALMRAMAASLAVVVVGWLAFLSAQQTTYWRDDRTLWTHALAVTTDNEIAHQNLGAVYLRANRVDEAIPHLEESVRLRPSAAETHRNLGLAYEAVAYHDQAVGRAAEAADRFAKAERHFAEAARLRPDWPLALQSLSWFYVSVPDERFDRPQDAVRLAEELVRITGGQGLIELAAAHAAAGNRDAALAAIDRYQAKLLQANPYANTIALGDMRRHFAAGGTLRNRHQIQTPNR